MSPYKSIAGNGKSSRTLGKKPRRRMGRFPWEKLAIGVLVGVGIGIGFGVMARILNPVKVQVTAPVAVPTRDPKVLKEREREAMAEMQRHIDSLDTTKTVDTSFLKLDPHDNARMPAIPTVVPAPDVRTP